VKFVSTTKCRQRRYETLVLHWPGVGQRGQALRRISESKQRWLDIHDGELIPTLENRRMITPKIREWKARHGGSLTAQRLPPCQSLPAFLSRMRVDLVIVPGFCHDVPALRKNPVSFTREDDFKKPPR